MKLPVILLCKGTSAPVATLLKGRGAMPSSVAIPKLCNALNIFAFKARNSIWYGTPPL